MFTVMTKHPQAIYRLSLAALFLVLGIRAFAADPLEAYVAAPDDAYKWELKRTETTNGFVIAGISMTSQTWRTSTWTHAIQLVRPVKMRHPEIALIFVSGDGSGKSYVPILAKLASEAGATAALLSKVPNQPLYGGKKEDALIAYTFQEYMKSGDDTWPALLPMVKSAVRAMDTVQAYSQKEHGEKVEKFVVTGASKRGWTTWLTAAVDKRVVGIAPMVIDMLNMKAQTQWAQKVYGKQSEQIHDYTDLNLVENMDHPRMVKLRGFVDPYSYRARYKLPKLILLGTNDPYWTVDSLRHYWDDLPEPKLVFQTPNAGHSLNGGLQAIDSLAAFYQMIADGEELPTMEWKMSADGQPHLQVKVNRAAKAMNLWMADSADRDFRDDKWSSKPLAIKPGSSIADADVEKPASGYRAFMGEVVLTNRFGHEYKLSTRVQVVPDQPIEKK
jgi:PhoPQ-activated pathogenicity-related protein